MPKKETQNNGQEPEKIVTKYDLKMQRRKEQKEKAAREERVSRIIGIAVVVALVCLVASFPIRNYLTINGTYVTVNGEKISKAEFDYNYNVARSSYLNQYGAYLGYFGLDMTRDVDTQMYSETMTWGDYFEELAVQNIARNKGIEKEARAEGFTYDTAEDYSEYQETLKEAVSEAGSTMKSYLKELYGPYATQARVKPYLEESFYVGAYTEAMAEKLSPSEEEIQAYYEENADTYDSIDYYRVEVDAELPTEPTELADPVEPEEGGEEGSEEGEGEEEPYQPSEAEIAAAMEAAKEEADKLEASVMTEGELITDARKASMSYVLTDWLFDKERKQGDTSVIEDSTNHKYYVVGFEKRYLAQTPTVDVRVALTAEDNGQAILDEWKSGAATEETFAEICDKYNDPAITTVEGGLLEGVMTTDVPTEIAEWMNDSSRQVGDTAVISPASENYTYVVYYKGLNDPEWMQRIRTTLRNEKVSEYLGTFTENVDVQDPKDHLAYLKIRAEEEAAAAASGEESGASDEGNADEQTSGEEGEAASSGEENNESQASGEESSDSQATGEEG
ncbi:MAG: hypothetical protein HFH85_08760 [Lachnospiraceae bacterium]|jgi:hypothetical protein|nr:hypothetical protein [Lachnospiraceae bacterium]